MERNRLNGIIDRNNQMAVGDMRVEGTGKKDQGENLCIIYEKLLLNTHEMRFLRKEAGHRRKKTQTVFIVIMII